MIRETDLIRMACLPASDDLFDMNGYQDAIATMGQFRERRGDLQGADAWFCRVAADDDSE